MGILRRVIFTVLAIVGGGLVGVVLFGAMIWFDFYRAAPIGATRAEVEARLPMEGGATDRFSSVHFLHPRFYMLKVQITFAPSQIDGGVKGKVSPNDQVVYRSQPYIQRPILD